MTERVAHDHEHSPPPAIETVNDKPAPLPDTDRLQKVLEQHTLNGDSADDTSEPLFDAERLHKVFEQYTLKDEKLQGNIYDGKYLLRPLATSDFHHGYMDLLAQLTECGAPTYEDFQRRFCEMKQCTGTYHILVIEDLKCDGLIIGTTTLVCEKKFIRQLGVRGRIEDVVVDNRYRGQQLGKLLVELLTSFAKEQCDCYKISLECKDQLVAFYEQFGYAHEDKQNYLCQRFTK